MPHKSSPQGKYWPGYGWGYASGPRQGWDQDKKKVSPIKVEQEKDNRKESPEGEGFSTPQN